MIVATWKHRVKSVDGRGAVEDGLDVVAAAEVERELDAGVDLRLVQRRRARRSPRLPCLKAPRVTPLTSKSAGRAYIASGSFPVSKNLSPVTMTAVHS